MFRVGQCEPSFHLMWYIVMNSVDVKGNLRKISTLYNTGRVLIIMSLLSEFGCVKGHGTSCPYELKCGVRKPCLRCTSMACALRKYQNYQKRLERRPWLISNCVVSLSFRQVGAPDDT